MGIPQGRVRNSVTLSQWFFKYNSFTVGIWELTGNSSSQVSFRLAESETPRSGEGSRTPHGITCNDSDAHRGPRIALWSVERRSH